MGLNVFENVLRVAAILFVLLLLLLTKRPSFAAPSVFSFKHKNRH